MSSIPGSRAIIGILPLWLVFLSFTAFSQEQPVFRTGVDLVVVDVTVVDDDGNPIRSLAPEDFIILVDGKPRRISSLEFISRVRTVAREEPVPEPVEEPTHYSTNEGAQPGRLILIVVDRGTIQRGEGRVAMTAAARFVDSLAPNDRVALLALPPGGPKVDFTLDHTRIKDGLGHIAGLDDSYVGDYVVGMLEALAIEKGDPHILSEVINRECYNPLSEEIDPFCVAEIPRKARRMAQRSRQQTRDALNVLTDLVRALELIEEPKILVLISEGYVEDQEMRGYFRQLGREAAKSRVNLYALQFEAPLMDASRRRWSPALLDDLDSKTDGMDTLAGMAGGTMFRALGSGLSTFARVEREISGYYLLGFEPEDDDRDGEPHRISVRVERDGATVRSREEFIIPSEPPTKTAADLVRETLETPLPATDFEINVATFNMRNPKTLAQEILLAVDGAKHTSAASLGWALFDDKGKEVDRGLEQLTGPLRYTTSVPLALGDHTLKIAVVDDVGARGSVEHAVGVKPQIVEGLELSDLLLVDLSIQPESPLIVSEARSRGNRRISRALHVPRADGRPDGPARGIASTETGPALVDSTGRLEETSHPGRWIARGAVSTESLPPARYVARIVLSRDGDAVAQVSRPFRLAVDPETPLVSVGVDRALPPLEALLSRVGQFVSSYEKQFSTVVAEEHYIQVERRGPLDHRSSIPEAASAAWKGRSVKALERRELRSDVLLVRAGGENWLGFRDVYEVNGKAIRNRDKRLETLFLAPSSDTQGQVRRIAEESARYNLGGVYRNFNVPTLPLLFLHPEYQHRFQFDKVGEETLEGVETWIIRFKEQAGPTFIKTAREENIFAEGRFWIDPEKGIVIRTELVAETKRDNIKCTVLVTYRQEPKSGLWAPYEMRERYGWTGYANAAYTECLASYSNFRRFTVETKEKVR